MAHLAPPAPPPGAVLDGHLAELETLNLLRRKLPATYTVFHGVHWSLGDRPRAVFGEADFVVVNQAGAVLVIEQKRGALEEGAGGLAKRYGGQAKSVPAQIHRTLDGLRDKFARQTGHPLDPDYLLFCPDHRVVRLEAAGLDALRIVDARDAGRLPERIRALLPECTADPAFAGRVARFLEGRLRFDTIRRFKGQQAAAVILTDVDMPVEPERMPDWQRLMFAALTRATDRVEIVASGPTADVLAGI